MPITSKQAIELEVALSSQLSPYLETCCLRVSANVSYEDAASDIKFFTGVEVSASSQQRLVHRQNFELPTLEQTVEELSVDGGNIRIRTPSGSICAWLGYKAISLDHLGMVGTSFQDNQVVIDWVNDRFSMFWPRNTQTKCHFFEVFPSPVSTNLCPGDFTQPIRYFSPIPKPSIGRI